MTPLPVYTCNSCDLMATTSPPTDPSSTIMRHVNAANEHDWLYYYCPRCHKTSCTIDTLEEHMAKCCGGTKEDIHRHAIQCVRWTRMKKNKAGWYRAEERKGEGVEKMAGDNGEAKTEQSVIDPMLEAGEIAEPIKPN